MSRRTARELLSYALVGLGANLAGYGVYLLLTHVGIAPKLSLTLIYALSALIGFVGNKQLTFRHSGSALSSGARYAIAYFGGYLFNLLIQFIGSDTLGYPHEWVQAIAIFLVAFLMFFLQKYYVFKVQAA